MQTNSIRYVSICFSTKNQGLPGLPGLPGIPKCKQTPFDMLAFAFLQKIKVYQVYQVNQNAKRSICIPPTLLHPRFTRFTKFTTMSTSAILLKMKVYQAHQVYQNEKTLVWPTTSLIYGSVSAGRENFSSYVTFFWKVEGWCGQTKQYWWLFSICGDLTWLRDAFKVKFDLSFTRKPFFTALPTWPFCKI